MTTSGPTTSRIVSIVRPAIPGTSAAAFDSEKENWNCPGTTTALSRRRVARADQCSVSTSAKKVGIATTNQPSREPRTGSNRSSWKLRTVLKCCEGSVPIRRNFVELYGRASALEGPRRALWWATGCKMRALRIRIISSGNESTLSTRWILIATRYEWAPENSYCLYLPIFAGLSGSNPIESSVMPLYIDQPT